MFAQKITHVSILLRKTTEESREDCEEAIQSRIDNGNPIALAKKILEKTGIKVDPTIDGWMAILDSKMDKIIIKEGEKIDSKQFKKLLINKSYSFINDTMKVVPECDYSKKDLIRESDTFIIKGAVQSGKTKNMLGHALISSMVGMKNVIIVRNITEDLNQLINAANQVTTLHSEFIKSFETTNESEKAVVDNFNSIRIVALNKIVDWMNPRDNVNTLVLLANGSQIKAINDIRNLPEFNLFIDEADAAFETMPSRARVSFKTELERLTAKSTKLFAVSATTISLYFKTGFSKCSNIIYVSPTENYHGVRYLKYKTVKKEQCGELLMDRHPGLIECLEELDTREPFMGPEFSLEKAHPTILLAKITTKKDDHTDMVDYVLEHFPNWVTIAYNGDGVEIGHADLEEVQIGTVTGRRRYGTNAFMVPGVGIQQALTYVKTFDKNVFIASGRMADRGINFVDSTYDWHITDQYLSVGSATTCTSVIQSLRILGVHRDTIPLTLWSTKKTSDAIKSYVDLDQALLDAGKYRHETTWHDFCKSLKIHSDRLPKINMCKRKNVFRVVNNAEQDTLRRPTTRSQTEKQETEQQETEQQETEQQETEQQETEQQETEQEEQQETNQEEARISEYKNNLLNLYEQGQGNKVKLINYFLDGGAPLTEQALDKDFDVSKPVKYMKWDKKTFKILVSENDKYVLNSEINDLINNK